MIERQRRDRGGGRPQQGGQDRGPADGGGKVELGRVGRGRGGDPEPGRHRVPRPDVTRVAAVGIDGEGHGPPGPVVLRLWRTRHSRSVWRAAWIYNNTETTRRRVERKGAELGDLVARVRAGVARSRTEVSRPRPRRGAAEKQTTTRGKVPATRRVSFILSRGRRAPTRLPRSLKIWKTPRRPRVRVCVSLSLRAPPPRLTRPPPGAGPRPRWSPRPTRSP
ncbi:pr3 [rat cytomegalovirus strain Maastricht]|uniref:Pr3 n=1 Tax=Rat cytomegalovirus (strain Maastricht) TaxID=79700 RepID=Q9DWH6_RCMVM|nr:pr3 [rat cytomegalovirus strain Maastricht]AAF99113.1 pr3 [rat cytomegalovirus strain Maastricht]